MIINENEVMDNLGRNVLREIFTKTEYESVRAEYNVDKMVIKMYGEYPFEPINITDCDLDKLCPFLKSLDNKIIILQGDFI